MPYSCSPRGSKIEMARAQTPGSCWKECLELIIRCNQHDFVGLAGALVSCGCFSVGAWLGHLLRRLLGVLLIGWGEVVDGVLHHVSWVYGFLQTTGDALHRRHVLCRGRDRSVLMPRQL